MFLIHDQCLILLLLPDYYLWTNLDAMTLLIARKKDVLLFCWEGGGGGDPYHEFWLYLLFLFRNAIYILKLLGL